MKLSFVSAACALALSALMSAHAAPLVIGSLVKVSDSNNNAFTGVSVTAPLKSTVSINTITGQVAAGLFVLNTTPVEVGGLTTELLAFCLQPNVFLKPFNNPFKVESMAVAGYTQGDKISELWGRYYGTLDTGHKAAAFQVALWELAYMPGVSPDLGAGTFQLVSSVDALVTSTAESWLKSLDGTGTKAQGLVVLRDIGNGTNSQDLITQGQVPEPGMLGLLAAGLAGLGLARRRARRNHQA